MTGTTITRVPAEARVRRGTTPVEPRISRAWSTRFWTAFSWHTVLFKNLRRLRNPWAQREMDRAIRAIVRDLKRAGAPCEGNWFEVPEITVDSLADPIVRQRVRKASTFVIRGGAAHWEAVKKWNLDYFETHYGDATVSAKADLMDDGVFVDRPIRELVADLRAGRPVYSGFAEDLLLENPSLMEDVHRGDIFAMMGVDTKRDASLVNFFRNGTISSIQMFIQGATSHTTFHMTKFHNFFVEIEGRKEWVLVDPRWSIGIEPNPSAAYYFITPKDVDSPDDPDDLYSYIPKMRTVIGPGDILFIPSYWWHDVRTYHSSHVMGMAIRASDWVLDKALFDFLLLFDRKTLGFFYRAFIQGQSLTEAEDAVTNIDGDLKRLGVGRNPNGPQ